MKNGSWTRDESDPWDLGSFEAETEAEAEPAAEAGGDFWGDPAVEEFPGDDSWGETAAEERAEDDFWGDLVCDTDAETDDARLVVERPARAQGLFTAKGHRVPLERVALGGEILGEHARLTVRQVYRNVERESIEAIYVFPLPPEAALAGFRVTVDGRELAGVLRPREAASEAYQEAVAAGHGAALLERERPGIHTLSLGNVLPGSTVEAEVEMLLRLEVREGETRLKIPTLVAPRYVPGVPQGGRTGDGVAPPTDRVPDADRITPPVGEAPYRLDLDLELLAEAGATVESPSHKIALVEEEGRRRVRFAAGGEPLDRDLVLVMRGAATVAGATAWISARRGKRTVAISLGAPVEERPVETPPLDIALVVDVSGSMAGAALEQAKRAARLCLRQLRSGDRVFLLEFDTSLYAFSRGPSIWSPELLGSADRWIDAERGGGGTELGRALQAAVEAVGGSPAAAVLVLTDGQVGQEEEIYRLVTAGKSAPRVCSIGIGTNVVGTLLERLAQATGGAVEEIHPGERIEPKVVAQFARLTARCWRDVKPVALPEGFDRLVPAAPWTILEGEPTSLFARLAGPLPKRLELEGRWGETIRRWSVDLVPAPGGVRPVLERFHAALRVRGLEEKLAAVEQRERGVGRGRAIAPGTAAKRAKALRRELEKLSIESGILSTATAWVAIEERAEHDRTGGLPATRIVPVAAPAGWAMFEDQMDEAHAALSSDRVQLYRKVLASATRVDDSNTFGPSWSNVVAFDYDLPTILRTEQSAQREVETGDDRWEVLSRQGGDGLWGDTLDSIQERLRETLEAVESLLEEEDLELIAERALRRAVDALLGTLGSEAEKIGAKLEAEVRRMLDRLVGVLDDEKIAERIRLSASRNELGRGAIEG